MKNVKEGIVVLSLFDGMSCGHLALDEANIKVDKYIANVTYIPVYPPLFR